MRHTPLAALAVIIALPAVAGNDSSTQYRVFAGTSYQRIFDLPIVGVVAGGSVGVEGRSAGVSLGGDLLWGWTGAGLTARNVRLSGSIDKTFERLRLGIGPTVSYFWIDRATREGSITAVAIGGHVEASFDIVKFSSRALYLGLQVNAQVFAPDTGPNPPAYKQGATVLWGSAGFVGMRF